VPSLTRKKAPITFVMSVRPSASTYQQGSHWTDFRGRAGLYKNAFKKPTVVKIGPNSPVFFLLLPATLNCLKSALVE
jgi:hypothetical protein